MELPSPAMIAWSALAAGVLAYDLAAPEGQMLSEGVDRALERSPMARAATLGAIVCTGLHLANLLPERVDPFKRGIELLR